MLRSAAMGHQHADSTPHSQEITADSAREIAELMQALATPSRVRIIGRLQQSPCAVAELASAVGMESSAVSHQLRILRNLRLVVGRRQGRSVIYELHDSHVGVLLNEAAFHIEHLRHDPQLEQPA